LFITSENGQETQEYARGLL